MTALLWPRWLLLATWGAGALMATTAQAASFDCANARPGIETQICGSPKLSRLDEDLAAAYRAATAASPNANAIKAAQREWLKTSRDACRSDDCLVQAYSQRIAALANDRPSSAPTTGTNPSAGNKAPPGPDMPKPAGTTTAAPERSRGGSSASLGPADRAAYEADAKALADANPRRGFLRRVELATRLSDFAARTGSVYEQAKALVSLAIELGTSQQFRASDAALSRAIALLDPLKGEAGPGDAVEKMLGLRKTLAEVQDHAIAGIALLPRRDEGLVERIGWARLGEELDRLLSLGQFDQAALLQSETERWATDLEKARNGHMPRDEYAVFNYVGFTANGALRADRGATEKDAWKRARAVIYLNSVRASVHSNHYQDVAKAVEFIERAAPNTLDAAVSLEYLGRAAIRAGMYRDVDEPLNRAIGMRENLMGENDPMIAEDLITMADHEARRRLPRWDRLEPLYARAHRIQVAALGEHDPATQKTLASLRNAQNEARADQAGKNAMWQARLNAFAPEPAIGQLGSAFGGFDARCMAAIGKQTAEALAEIQKLMSFNAPTQALAAKSLARSSLQMVRSVGCAPR